MKTKTVLFLMTFTVFTQFVFAQCGKNDYPFFEGVVGVGIIPTFAKDQIQTEFPPALCRLDYRLNNRYSFGVFAGHTIVRSITDLLGDGAYEEFRNRFSMGGIRFAVHSTYFEKWDLYGGMNFAYTISKVEVLNGNITQLKNHLNYKPVRGAMMTSAFLGAKYLIKPKTTLFGEVGYGISLLSFGVTRKL
jgi:hypothetical protein